jgi:ribonuclease P protein component
LTNCSIKKSADFKKVLDKNHKAVSKSMVLFHHINELTPNREVRLGLVVSKKNGIAPVRNRIKRRLRSAFSIVRASYQIKLADIVLIARKPAYDIDFSELVGDLTYCLKKNKII